MLCALGDHKPARDILARALELEPHYVEAMNNLATVLDQLGETREALALYRQALATDPSSRLSARNLKSLVSRLVPPWHMALINDTHRRQAFAKALAPLAPGRAVVNVGASAGLVAMLAARAGASRVVALEPNGMVADAARQVVIDNGLDDRVRVLAGGPEVMLEGRDFFGRFDLAVIGGVSAGTVDEETLAAVEDIWNRWLRPDGRVLPSRIAARGALVGGPSVMARLHASRIDGFDLRGFGDLAPPRVLFDTGADLGLASDPIDLLSLDLARPPFPPQEAQVILTARRAGPVGGVAQWLAMDLGPEARVETRPGDRPAEGLGVTIVHRLPVVLDLKAGDRVVLAVGHDRRDVWVELVDVAPAAGRARPRATAATRGTP